MKSFAIAATFSALILSACTASSNETGVELETISYADTTALLREGQVRFISTNSTKSSRLLLVIFRDQNKDRVLTDAAPEALQFFLDHCTTCGSTQIGPIMVN